MPGVRVQDPFEALLERLRRDGVMIRCADDLPAWEGTAFDLGYAMQTLWRPQPVGHG